ncbi:hypothetical protein [Anaeromicropila herbilytica]|uniref:Uncharacterized protein n=1 Tax=Anaeromicropila herbilytica TaxID=2785025 RepID=A0A7R7ENP0_9FIRM|nr:hypothetical protein [Anaeromicropila herbilytica]BCN31936.1 hypothetical protein bsdtb5_32310 [Anaeromicropila herbilytica]
MAKKKEDIDFREALKSRRIPILTLDTKWHALFDGHEKPSNIKELEKKLNELMKSQGQKVNDIKDLKALKKKLMDEIIQNMDTSTGGALGSLKVKKQIKSQQLIQDINDKLRQADDDLADLPYLIKAVNEELLIESMKICYDRLRMNEEEINKYGEWITRTREELKKNLIIKQEMEADNSALYSYMHNMLGANVIQQMDVKEGL